MTDALHLLRAANPEDPATLSLPPTLRPERVVQRRARVTRRRPARPLTFAVALVAVLVIALVVSLGGANGPGLAERAYAATDDPGVAHWRVRIDAYTDGTLSTRQTEEGWAKGTTTHVLLTTGGDKPVVTERRTDGDQQQFRIDGGPVTSGPAGRTDLERMLPGKDPFAAFRNAYLTQRLRQSSESGFEVVPEDSETGAPMMVYDIDPSTAAPKQLTETFAATSGAPAMKVVMTFDHYEILEPTEQNLAALAMTS